MSDNKRQVVTGRELIRVLKDHGLIDDERIKDITIFASYDDVATVTVNKVMTSESEIDDSKDLMVIEYKKAAKQAEFSANTISTKANASEYD